MRIDDHVADVPNYFRGIDLQLYAPNPSSGMKFKVLESFAFGVPVVTNAYGVEGLPARDGTHAGISDDNAGMIERTEALLRDPVRREGHRRAARVLLEEHCTPGPVMEAHEDLYQQILEDADR